MIRFWTTLPCNDSTFLSIELEISKESTEFLGTPNIQNTLLGIVLTSSSGEEK